MIAILSKINKCTANIVGSAVISTDCSFISNSMSQDTVNKYAPGITNALMTIQDRHAAPGFIKGKYEAVVIKTTDGYVFMAQLNASELFVVITKPGINIDFILLLIKRSLRDFSTQASKNKTTALSFMEWTYNNPDTDNSTITTYRHHSQTTKILSQSHIINNPGNNGL